MWPVLIGDIVKIEGVVTEVSTIYNYFKLDNNPTWIPRSYAKDVTTPWSPKVGDEVDIRNKATLSSGFTVLAIQKQDNEPHRQWAVIAFKSDIPSVVLLSTLKQRVQ